MIILLLDLIAAARHFLQSSPGFNTIFKITTNSINLLFFWAISHNVVYAEDNYFSKDYAKKWQISFMSIIKEMPYVDNAQNISGLRLGIAYPFYNYRDFLELGVDLSTAYLKTSAHKNKPNFSKSIVIISPALIVHWNFTRLGNITPYLVAGIGPSFLSNNDFEGRKLGLRFSFQDVIGTGLRIGEQNNLSLGLHLIHYSNASLNKHNRGITTPLALHIGYNF